MAHVYSSVLWGVCIVSTRPQGERNIHYGEKVAFGFLLEIMYMFTELSWLPRGAHVPRQPSAPTEKLA